LSCIQVNAVYVELLANSFQQAIRKLEIVQAVSTLTWMFE